MVTVVGLKGGALDMTKCYGEAPSALSASLKESLPQFARDKVEHISLDSTGGFTHYAQSLHVPVGVCRNSTIIT